MGLDMYLEAEGLLWRYNDDDDPNGEVRKDIHTAIPWMEQTNEEGYIKVVKEIGYWRKANHIHAWFVKNVQDGKDECDRVFVEKKQLQELLAVCKKVKEYPEEASNLLPTTSGFFFGGTEYDEYYHQQIDATIEIIESVLANVPDSYSIYYHSSW